jgi:N-acetylglucosaminyldiphosphoundecaprenol N-acetyl-beta-D-mannosaminyltransferase
VLNEAQKATAPSPKSTAWESVELFNIRFSKVTLDQVKAILTERIRSRVPGYVVTPNVDHVCMCYHEPMFRESYERAFLRLTDGKPVLWASRLFGEDIPEKLSGSDLLPKLCGWAAEQGYSVFFLGGTPGTADRSAEILKQRHPGLRIAGVNCPPFGFEKHPVQIQAVIEHVRAARPDICFLGLGSPKQELLMSHYRDALRVPVLIGIGGSFDFVSGRTRRAPEWVQNLGFEWMWRLSMEPKRLWRRYLVDDIVFFKLIYLEFSRRLRRRLLNPRRSTP